MTTGILNQTTCYDICYSALKEVGVVGVGQIPLAEDINDAQARLNWMLAEWNTKRFLIYHLRDLSIVSTGAANYTLGPGGQIDTNPVSAFGVQNLSISGPGAGYALGDTIVLSAVTNSSPSISGVTQVDNEVPSGVCNGVNVTFTLANTPKSSQTVALYLNGLRLLQGNDYTVLGYTIIMSTIPQTGDNLLADYQY